MQRLKYYFWIVDLGFILYWIVTYFKLIPPEYLFPDYENALLVTWNWSFLPLDLAISFTGFTSLYLFKRKDDRWQRMAPVSLVLTSCSGLQAISFWAIQGWFDWGWWLPNLFLLLYPMFFLPSFLRRPARNPL